MGQAVLDPQSGQQVYYPDNTSSDEIEHSMNDFTQGAIRAYKPSWYDTYIKEPLQKMGASIYDPVMSAKAAVAGIAEGLRPMVPQNAFEPTGKPFAPVQFKDESSGIAPSPYEQEIYKKVSPLSYNASNLVSSQAPLALAAMGTEGMSELAAGVPMIAKMMGGIASLVKAGTLSAEGVKTAATALKFGVAMGAAGEAQSASKQQELYGNIDWHEVAKDTATQAGFGLIAGGVFGYLSKPLSELMPQDLIAHSSKLMMASGTMMAAQTKMSGGSNRDALLAFGGGALLAGLSLHGDVQEFREATLNEFNDLKARYFVSQTGAEETAARQAMTEHTTNDAEQMINEANQGMMERNPTVAPVQERQAGPGEILAKSAARMEQWRKGQEKIAGKPQVPGTFSDPYVPALLDHLAQYIPARYVAGMDGEERLALANGPWQDLRDVSLKYESGELPEKPAILNEKPVEINRSSTDIEDDARRARGIAVSKTALDEVASSKELTTNLVAKTLNEVTGGGEKTTTRGEVKEGSDANKSGTKTGSGSEEKGIEGQTRTGLRVRDDDGEGTVKTEVEGKVAKSSQDIADQLSKRGMTNLSDEDKAHFESTSYKGKTEELTELMRTDPQQAERIATGEESSSLSPSEKQLLFNMVKLKSLDDGNSDLGVKLARSPLNVERSEAAKTLGASGFDNGDFGKDIDPIKTIKGAEKEMSGKTSKTIAKKISKEISEGIEKVKKESVPKQSEFDKFIATLRC